MDKTRQCALRILRRVWEHGAYSNIELSHGMDKYALTGRDRAFCAALVNGTLERILTLDFMISLVSDKAEIDPELKAVLRLGFQQLFYMKVPDMAACGESAELVREKSKRGFINGVMRSACRRREELVLASQRAGNSVKYSLSPEICALLEAQYGFEAEKIMASFFDPSPLVLRAQALRISAFDLVKRLCDEGAEAREHPSLKGAVIVKNGASSALTAIKQGLAFAQGLSSQTAVAALEAKPGETVVDVCACPGGKTLGAAIDMEDRGRVISMDLHKNKLSLIEKSAAALGLNIIETSAHNGKTPRPELIGIADRVICDVPCTGLGAIKGRPEIRYKTFDTVKTLITAQSSILESAFCYLKPGGRLVYSTCTLNRDENECVAEEFAAKSGAALINEKTILPYKEGFDGFYIAVFEKL